MGKWDIYLLLCMCCDSQICSSWEICSQNMFHNLSVCVSWVETSTLIFQARERARAFARLESNHVPKDPTKDQWQLALHSWVRVAGWAGNRSGRAVLHPPLRHLQRSHGVLHLQVQGRLQLRHLAVRGWIRPGPATGGLRKPLLVQKQFQHRQDEIKTVNNVAFNLKFFFLFSPQAVFIWRIKDNLIFL